MGLYYELNGLSYDAFGQDVLPIKRAKLRPERTLHKAFDGIQRKPDGCPTVSLGIRGLTGSRLRLLHGCRNHWFLSVLPLCRLINPQ